MPEYQERCWKIGAHRADEALGRLLRESLALVLNAVVERFDLLLLSIPVFDVSGNRRVTDDPCRTGLSTLCLRGGSRPGGITLSLQLQFSPFRGIEVFVPPAARALEHPTQIWPVCS